MKSESDKVEITQIYPAKIWKNKDAWYEKVKKSRKEWSEMSDEQRKAVVRYVYEAMHRMAHKADEWLPDAVTTEGGNNVEITFNLLFTDIDKGIERDNSENKELEDCEWVPETN